MKNNYEIRGDVTALFIKCGAGKTETIVSTDTLKRVMEFPNMWYATYSPNTKTFYAMGKITNDEGIRVNIGMHRWIVNPPKGMVVDHINHDTLDNSDDNLRIITHAENQQNRRGASSVSKSGIRGVYWSDNLQKWQVIMGVGGYKKYLGCYASLEEAKGVAIEARKQYMPYATG